MKVIAFGDEVFECIAWHLTAINTIIDKAKVCAPCSFINFLETIDTLNNRVADLCMYLQGWNTLENIAPILKEWRDNEKNI